MKPLLLLAVALCGCAVILGASWDYKKDPNSEGYKFDIGRAFEEGRKRGDAAGYERAARVCEGIYSKGWEKGYEVGLDRGRREACQKPKCPYSPTSMENCPVDDKILHTWDGGSIDTAKIIWGAIDTTKGGWVIDTERILP